MFFLQQTKAQMLLSHLGFQKLQIPPTIAAEGLLGPDLVILLTSIITTHPWESRSKNGSIIYSQPSQQGI